MNRKYNKKKYKNIIDNLRMRGYKYIGSGGTRDVFKRGNFVIKVPRNVAGEVDNDLEGYVFHDWLLGEGPTHFTPAPARLLSNKCLLMVYVEPFKKSDLIPSWVRDIDNEQAGMYKGIATCYDYANECDERFDGDFHGY